MKHQDNLQPGALVASLDQLSLLLFLHARPCRTYPATYLQQKLQLTEHDCLAQLVERKLVVEVTGKCPAFGYGVESAAQLAAVDQLARLCQAVSALLGFMARLSRQRGASARERAERMSTLVKPRQAAAYQRERPAAALTHRVRRRPRMSLAAAMR